MSLDNSGYPTYNAVHYEANENDTGIIRNVFFGDEETILIQQIPAGQKLAFTDLHGVSPLTHVVIGGVVKLTSEILAGL